MKKLFSTNYSDGAFNFGILLLRLAAGLLMAVNHGYAKLTHFNTAAAKFGDPIGLGPKLSFTLLVFAEFFCALFLAVGFLSRFSAFALAFAMGVAFFIAHKGQYHNGDGGGETSLVFLVMYLTLLFVGPGKFSVDRLITK